MPLTYVSGDPLLTHCQTLGFGHNAAGRTEVGALATALLYRYPAAFAAYGRQCRGGKVKAGDVWLWPEGKQQLGFLAIRATAVGTTRMRYLEAALMTLARDYHLYGIRSLALADLSGELDWMAVKDITERWFAKSKLAVVVYEHYAPGVEGER
jgi:hypothetical protein